MSNAAVYYVFDRDNESNLYCEVESLSSILVNSRDNGVESNGLLLISYPCIESYIKTCIDDFQGEVTDSPKSLKKEINKAQYQYNKLGTKEIIKACNNMLLGIKYICGRDMTSHDLDDFTQIGRKVLSEENQLYIDIE